jgi:hypothetical protein
LQFQAGVSRAQGKLDRQSKSRCGNHVTEHRLSGLWCL